MNPNVTNPGGKDGDEAAAEKPTNEIYPCPFCGSASSIEEIPSLSPDKVFFSIGCDSETESECMGYQSFTHFNTRKEAISAWNKRARSQSRAEVEEFIDTVLYDAERIASAGFDIDQARYAAETLADKTRVFLSKWKKVRG